jgi:phosphohistidine phosphatase
MKLLIVRHADAGDQEEFAKTGKPDHLRPLSRKGEDQMRAAAAGLAKLVKSVDLIVTSPYVRAVQTADIVRSAYGSVPQETSRTLEPEVAPEKFVEWLRSHDDKDVICAVGHEPHLGILTTWLIAGIDDSRVDMKKGGACLLDFEKRAKKGAATLRWLMGPKVLAAVRITTDLTAFP